MVYFVLRENGKKRQWYDLYVSTFSHCDITVTMKVERCHCVIQSMKTGVQCDFAIFYFLATVKTVSQ